MEKLKKEVLALLTENARFTLRQLSDITGAEENAVERAVKDLEDSGVIVKYAAIVNNEKLAEQRVEALIEVKVAPQKLKGFDSYAD